MLNSLFFLFFALVNLSVQQKDPLKDFCRLFGHQTTIVDRKQYIDGGLVNWSPITAGSTNYTSTWLREGSLDENNQGFPQHSTLAKNETVPSVNGGVLWADEVNKVVYQYGGEYGDGKPEDFNLWYYDIVYNTWNISNASTTNVARAAWGAGVMVPEKAQGYYYGGWLTNASVPGYGARTALSQMLVYDMVSNSFRNQSGPDDVPRAEGVMLHLPAGDTGLLVYFGGLESRSINSTDSEDATESEMVGVPMSDIHVYSIGDNRWYKQTASGDVPEQRRRFCAGATWADDRSSYNIYLYGGASVGDGLGFGDVYVLSLPSFTWIKYWPRPEDDAGTIYPHHSLSCDVINGSQMIIMGGHFTNFSDCDVPSIYAQHGLDLGKSNDEGAKWALFNPNLTTYQVPDEIHKTIGGGPTGGATLLAPRGDWEERDLSVQFTRTVAAATRTPTREISIATASSTPTTTPPKSSENDKSGMLGGAIGGALGGLLLVAAIGFCLFFLRRRRSSSKGDTRPLSELPAQIFVSTKSPTLSTQPSYNNASVTLLPHTPQGSPPSPFPYVWTQPGQTHEMLNPNASVVYAPQPQFANVVHHQRSVSNESCQPSTLVSGYSPKQPHQPIVHEMPSIRSPPLIKEHPPSPQGEKQLPPTIDPYYAQHPPSPPQGRLYENIDQVSERGSPKVG